MSLFSFTLRDDEEHFDVFQVELPNLGAAVQEAFTQGSRLLEDANRHVVGVVWHIEVFDVHRQRVFYIECATTP